MARSWPSMTPGDPTSGFSRSGSARRAPPASCTRHSTCSTWTVDRCWTSRSRTASACSRACSRTTRASGYAAHIEGEGLAFHAAAASQGLEGVVAKLRRSRYEPGKRSSAWLKIKIRPEQEFVVGGWTPGEGNARDLGAVVVGVYEGSKLRFAGKVGSGFDARTRRPLRERLAELELGPDDPPFDPAPSRDHRGRWGGELKHVVWVKPEMVIRVESAGWSRDGMVRQAAFKGIEAGRDPREVTREIAVETIGRGPKSTPMPRPTPTAPKTTADAKTTDATTAGPKPPGRRARRRRLRPRPRPVQRAPADAGRRLPAAASATDTELAALDALGKEGTWHVGGDRQDLKLTNLDKPLFRRPRTTPPTRRSPSANSSATSPGSRPRCCRTSPSGRSTSSASPTAPTRPGSGRRTSPRPRRSGCVGGARPASMVGRTGRQRAPHRGRRRDDVLARQPGELRDPCLDRPPTRGVEPDLRAHRHRPRREDDLGRDARPRSAVPDRAGPSRRSRLSRRRPASAASRSGSRSCRSTRSRRPAAGSSASRKAVGSTVPDLVSWEWAKDARKGKARLDYTQNASIKTLVAPYAVRPARGAPVSAPITWDELDDPALRPDLLDDPDASSNASRTSATSSRPPRPTPRSSRRSDQ